LLPSIDSELIKVSYNIEISIGHSGSFGKAFDLPSITLPIDITVNPKGPIAQVVNF
jgi:hypothetical protein